MYDTCMTHYEQALHDLPQNPGSFFRLEEDGIAFVDPLYGERLGPWPRILEHDTISRVGREYLQSASHRLDVVHSSHGAQEDFLDILREHGQVLEAAAVIAIEADWDPTYIDDFSQPGALKMPKGRRGVFTSLEIGWARDRGKIVMPYDIDGPDDPLRRGLIKLFSNDLGADAIPFPKEVPPQKHAALAQELCQGAYVSMRHSMLLGQLGFGLRTLVRGGHIEPDAPVAAMLGIGHYPAFTDKARASGFLPPENISAHPVEQPTIDWLAGSDISSLVRMTATSGMTTLEMLAY